MSNFVGVINVDLDGVVYPFHETLAYWVEAIRQDGIERPDPTQWNFAAEWGMSEGEWMNAFRRGVEYGVIWKQGRPLPGAQEYLWRLSDDGFKLRIVTHRLVHKFSHKIVQEYTAEWLDKWNIPYWEIIYMGPDASKADYYADFAIDDNINNAEQQLEAGVASYLFTRPWNSEFFTTCERVDSWKEFYESVMKSAETV